ncbi:MAG: transferrin-binding protein-like solute binding protein [Rubricella sp.]
MRLVFGSGTALVLAACGGGGGGTSTPSFQSADAVTASSTVSDWQEHDLTGLTFRLIQHTATGTETATAVDQAIAGGDGAATNLAFVVEDTGSGAASGDGSARLTSAAFDGATATLTTFPDDPDYETRLAMPTGDAAERIAIGPNLFLLADFDGEPPQAYVSSGYWVLEREGATETAYTIAHGVFGYETGTMPTLGIVDYRGAFLGQLTSEVNDLRVAVDGRVDASVNFGATNPVLTGSVSGISSALTSNITGDVTFTAPLAGNAFTGTVLTGATTDPQTGMALQSGTSGTIDGAFFGPTAREIGGALSVSDGSRHLLGSITAGEAP